MIVQGFKGVADWFAAGDMFLSRFHHDTSRLSALTAAYVAAGRSVNGKILGRDRGYFQRTAGHQGEHIAIGVGRVHEIPIISRLLIIIGSALGTMINRYSDEIVYNTL